MIFAVVFCVLLALAGTTAAFSFHSSAFLRFSYSFIIRLLEGILHEYLGISLVFFKAA